MSKTLVIGAAGNIGRILLNRHTQALAPVVAMVRDQSKVEFPASVAVIEANLEQDFSQAMEGCTTVIFTAGSGAATGLDKTFLVDLWGACKAIDTAKALGVQHFIMVSSRGADNPDRGPIAIKPYLIAKHVADEHLMRSGLPYTILRPGRLTDEQASGLVTTTRPSDLDQQFISRSDTAEAVVHCVNNATVINKVYELYHGKLSIQQALAL